MKKDFDWEYMAEKIAQGRYFTKSNLLTYATLKDIAETEYLAYMENENDTLRECRKRIYKEYNKLQRSYHEMC